MAVSDADAFPGFLTSVLTQLFFRKSTYYFSHMLLQRWEAKIRRKESSPQPGIELTTTRSWVRHAHHWATRPGHTDIGIVMSLSFLVNTLPNDTILVLTKLKVFADDKFNVAKMMISLFDSLENIVGKGENAGYQHFSPFPTMFSKSLCFRVVTVKIGIVW